MLNGMHGWLKTLKKGKHGRKKGPPLYGQGKGPPPWNPGSWQPSQGSADAGKGQNKKKKKDRRTPGASHEAHVEHEESSQADSSSQPASSAGQSSQPDWWWQAWQDYSQQQGWQQPQPQQPPQGTQAQLGAWDNFQPEIAADSGQWYGSDYDYGEGYYGGNNGSDYQWGDDYEDCREEDYEDESEDDDNMETELFEDTPSSNAFATVVHYSDVPQNGFSCNTVLPVSLFPEKQARNAKVSMSTPQLTNSDLPLQQCMHRSSARKAVQHRVNMADKPPCVIMDLSCTRSMGSLQALRQLERTARRLGIQCKWKPCNTLMTFANGDSERLM